MANEVNITGGSFTSSNPQAVTVNARTYPTNKMSVA